MIACECMRMREDSRMHIQDSIYTHSSTQKRAMHVIYTCMCGCVCLCRYTHTSRLCTYRYISRYSSGGSSIIRVAASLMLRGTGGPAHIHMYVGMWMCVCVCVCVYAPLTLRGTGGPVPWLYVCVCVCVCHMYVCVSCYIYT